MKRLNAMVAVLVLCCAHPMAQAGEAYLRAVDARWQVRPILSVGEKAENGYAMTGVPDGLGAHANGDGTLMVLMNHEIAAGKGAVRAHGAKGAFVSSWVLRLADLKVLKGTDLIRKVVVWDGASATYQPGQQVAFGRFCSADMAEASAFYDASSGKGFQQRLMLNGEEEKDLGGRVFAHVATGAFTGTSFELPHLGRVAWENLLALPDAGVRTVVIGMDDFPGGHVYVYVGEKRGDGNPAEQAGLVGGALYAVKFSGERFVLLPLGHVVGVNGRDLRARAKSLGATPLLRPEDGAWDKLDKNRFWFVTTDKIDGLSQLFSLDFDDAKMPEKGGKLRVVLTAKDIGGQMFDNIAVDSAGRVLLDEDSGESQYASGIWLYNPRQPAKVQRIAEAAPEYFVDANSPSFMTVDEEQSGIMEVTALVVDAPWFDAERRYYLGVTQIHAPHPDAALVEYGQLYLLSGPKE